MACAQGTRFFRICGPAATTIISFNPDGTLVWSNAEPDLTYTIQTISSLPGGTNWVDYVQIPVANSVNTNLVIAFNPPADMALIPAGVFTMGSSMDTNEAFADTTIPPHTVYVSAFYMDQYNVSWALWKQVYNWATNHGYTFDYVGAGKATNYPVQSVDWYDCVKWCNARSEMEGQIPAYYTDAKQTEIYRTGDLDLSNSCVNWNSTGYRLPTEAEWEKAARGGLVGQRFPWGNTISWDEANYDAYPSGYSYDVNPTNGFDPAYNDGVDPYTSPVNAFAANGYGLYDMSGNSWQWCWDWYDPSWYRNAEATQNNTRGPASSPYGGRVLRGGDWLDFANLAKCANRFYDSYPNNAGNFGFRCARGL